MILYCIIEYIKFYLLQFRIRFNFVVLRLIIYSIVIKRADQQTNST